MEEMRGCLTSLLALLRDWIISSGLFRHFGSDNRIAGLSDDIISNILSRVPATSVLACKAVCSSWNRLTNTTQFPEMHLNNQVSPVIFGRVQDLARSTWFFINGFRRNVVFENVQLKGMEDIRRAPIPCVLASCNGLLIFGDNIGLYVICNPVTGEQVAFNLGEGDRICGFFFHQSDKEYKLLVFHTKTNDANKRYALYGLSSKDWRTLGTPFHYNLYCPGVATYGALSWAVRGTKISTGISVKNYEIVMFDTLTETFVVKPQPADRYKCEARTGVKLLDIGGNLGCCDIYGKSLEVWILEDTERWRWVKRYVVDLDRYISKGADRDTSIAKTLVIGVQDGNLLVFRSYVGLLWCNLQRNDVRKLETGEAHPKGFGVSVHGVQYTSSLVSLKKCNILQGVIQDDVLPI